MKMSSRSPYSFPDFSLRRLLLQGARAARGSPPLGTRLCVDVERGTIKHDKSHVASTSGNSKTNASDTTSQHSGTPPSSNSANHQRLSSTVASPNKGVSGDSSSGYECALCYNNGTPEDFYGLLTCKHDACRNCLESYLMIEILESRTDIACPQCSDSMHPSDIQALLVNHPEYICKYEDFMVRRVLLSDPDSRWCPAPDCSYAVIATGCASCPRIKCERPGCDINFCYHCKAEWHPDQTCDAARASRQSPTRAPSGSISQDSHHRDDIKPCPRCQVLIVKMDDGSCNHMVCAVCGSEFCWLCMKEISDLHYLSPSGCTFWGKKPWSRKKKLLWQLGTLVGAPVGIALVAGIAVPAMIIGIPVWVGRKIHTRYRLAGKHKRNCAVLGGVAASVLVSPVLAGLAVAIGVPILLFYVYGVVPVSLCRAGCGVSTTRDGFKFDFDEEEAYAARNQDASSVDAVSRIGATSIGEVSLSVTSGSHLGVSSHNPLFGMPHASSTRESTTALAGSITGHRLEVQADISSSETASAVTCVSEKSGNTLNDTASTRALAGSVLSYKPSHMDSSNISEDGVSERVRFDNNVCYVIDGKRDCPDSWYMAALDQESCGDKTSVSSGRSFREDIDAATIHKRMTFAQSRIPKLNSSQHRTVSIDSTNNIPELTNQEDDEQQNNDSDSIGSLSVSQQQRQIATTNNLNNNDINVPSTNNNAASAGPITAAAAGDSVSQTSGGGDVAAACSNNNIVDNHQKNTTMVGSGCGAGSSSSSSGSAVIVPATTSKSLNSKNMSKVAILRNLFFSQNNQQQQQQQKQQQQQQNQMPPNGNSSKS